MKIRATLALLPLTLIAIAAAAAPPHTITWSKKSAAVGSPLRIAGKDFVIVRIPVRAFTGEKYAITLPAPVAEGGQFEGVFVQTSHGTDGFQSNVTIDTYPALASVGDSRTYTLYPDYFTLDPADNLFTVSAQVGASVQIQLGTTLVYVGESFESKNPLTGVPPETEINTGTDWNITGYAASEWWKWTDPVAQVIAVDTWVDYVRVYKY